MAEADIVGRIAPRADIREAPTWDAPTRIVEVSDASGRLHGRIIWLAEEVNPAFERAVLDLYVAATTESFMPPRSAAASSAPGRPA